MRKFLMIVLLVFVVLLSSCKVRVKRFDVTLKPQLTSLDIVDVITMISEKNNYSDDQEIPHDHFVIGLESSNNTFTLTNLAVGINVDFDGSEYVFESTMCNINITALECSTNPMRTNKNEQLEESIPLSVLLSALEMYNLQKVLDVLMENYLEDTYLPMEYTILIEYFDDEDIIVDDLISTVFIDQSVVVNTGEYNADGFYLTFYVKPLVGEDIIHAINYRIDYDQ